MPTSRRLLSRRRLLALAGVVAVLFGLAMLHPYPRQSLFGPTIRGKPWCSWEYEVRIYALDAAPKKPFWLKSMEWLRFKHEPMEPNDLFNHAEMTPLLLHLANDPDPVFRRFVVSQFYWHANLNDQSALPVLQARLNDPDLDCRIAAAMALATIEPKERVHPVLVQILDDPKSRHRYEAMRALSYLAQFQPDAFVVMLHYAKDPDRTIRAEIMMELSRYEKRGVPFLIQGVQDPDAVVRKAALSSLIDLGADARDAVPLLERCRNDPDPLMRMLAAIALTAIDPDRFGHLKVKGD